MDDNLKTIVVQAIITLPATVAAIAAAYVSIRASRTADAASKRTAGTLEQIRSSSSLTTDRVGQLVNGVSDMGRRVSELGKK